MTGPGTLQLERRSQLQWAEFWGHFCCNQVFSLCAGFWPVQRSVPTKLALRTGRELAQHLSSGSGGGGQRQPAKEAREVERQLCLFPFGLGLSWKHQSPCVYVYVCVCVQMESGALSRHWMELLGDYLALGRNWAQSSFLGLDWPRKKLASRRVRAKLSGQPLFSKGKNLLHFGQILPHFLLAILLLLPPCRPEQAKCPRNS